MGSALHPATFDTSVKVHLILERRIFVYYISKLIQLSLQTAQMNHASIAPWPPTVAFISLLHLHSIRVAYALLALVSAACNENKFIKAS
jgi:hypothetical protein